MKYFVLLMCLFLTLVTVKSFAKNDVIVSPPELVSCVSGGTCDQVSDHLTNYLNAYYEWYIVSRENILEEKETKKRKSDSKKEKTYWSQRDSYLIGALSEKLKTSYLKQEKAYDGDSSAPLCQDHDADVITCLLNPADKLLAPVQSTLMHIDKNSAVLSVVIPKYQRDNRPANANLITSDGIRIYVTLVAEKGSWKIDEVTDLSEK